MIANTRPLVVTRPIPNIYLEPVRCLARRRSPAGTRHMANLYIPSEMNEQVKEAHSRLQREADDGEYVSEWQAMAQVLFHDDATADLRDRRGGEL